MKPLYLLRNEATFPVWYYFQNRLSEMNFFSGHIKHFSTLILLWLLCSGIQSQVITISEELPLRNDYDYTILGWISGDLLLFRDRGHQFYIQAFDEEMHLKWEREILLGPHKADIIGLLAHP